MFCDCRVVKRIEGHNKGKERETEKLVIWGHIISIGIKRHQPRKHYKNSPITNEKENKNCFKKEPKCQTSKDKISLAIEEKTIFKK